MSGIPNKASVPISLAEPSLIPNSVAIVALFASELISSLSFCFLAWSAICSMAAIAASRPNVIDKTISEIRISEDRRSFSISRRKTFCWSFCIRYSEASLSVSLAYSIPILRVICLKDSLPSWLMPRHFSPSICPTSSPHDSSGSLRLLICCTRSATSEDTFCARLENSSSICVCLSFMSSWAAPRATASSYSFCRHIIRSWMRWISGSSAIALASPFCCQKLSPATDACWNLDLNKNKFLLLMDMKVIEVENQVF